VHLLCIYFSACKVWFFFMLISTLSTVQIISKTLKKNYLDMFCTELFEVDCI